MCHTQSHKCTFTCTSNIHIYTRHAIATRWSYTCCHVCLLNFIPFLLYYCCLCVSVTNNYTHDVYVHLHRSQNNFKSRFLFFPKPLRLLYSVITYFEFSLFALYSLLLLSFFLYLKRCFMHVIVHVHQTYT